VVALVFSDQGTAVAAVSSSLLCEDFPNIAGILMVGIAGGVPDVGKPERHVRLGDIVASGEHGVIAYDFVKEHPDKFEPRHPPRPPHADLYRACRRLSANAASGDLPWLSFLSRAAHLPSSARPGVETDVLASSTDHQVLLSHPHDPARRIGEPRVFLGTIACANRLLKNPVRRDQLRDQFDVVLMLYHADNSRIFQSLPVISTDLSIQKIGGLLGRDVLEKCLLVFDGSKQSFCLAF